MRLDERGQDILSSEETSLRLQLEARYERPRIVGERIPHVTRMLNAAGATLAAMSIGVIALVLASWVGVVDMTREGPRLLVTTCIAVLTSVIIVAGIGCVAFWRERAALYAQCSAYDRVLGGLQGDQELRDHRVPHTHATGEEST